MACSRCMLEQLKWHVDYEICQIDTNFTFFGGLRELTLLINFYYYDDDDVCDCSYVCMIKSDTF